MTARIDWRAGPAVVERFSTQFIFLRNPSFSNPPERTLKAVLPGTWSSERRDDTQADTGFDTTTFAMLAPRKVVDFRNSSVADIFVKKSAFRLFPVMVCTLGCPYLANLDKSDSRSSLAGLIPIIPLAFVYTLGWLVPASANLDS